MTNFDEIAAELTETAIKYPFDPIAFMDQNSGKVEFPGMYAREFVYNGYPLRVQLTLSELRGQKAFILSMADRTQNTLPETLVETIRQAFFGNEFSELPSIHRYVRKFIQFVE